MSTEEQSPINHNAIIKHKGGKGTVSSALGIFLFFTLANNPYHLERAKIKGKTPQLSFLGASVD